MTAQTERHMRRVDHESHDTVIAMRPSGDWYITTGPDKRYWLHTDTGLSDGKVNEMFIADLVVYQGWLFFEEPFGDPKKLEEVRQQKTLEKTEKIPTATDEVDLSEVFNVVERWMNNGKIRQAKSMLYGFLHLNKIRLNDSLREKIRSILTSSS